MANIITYDILYFDDDRADCHKTEKALNLLWPKAETQIEVDDVHGYRLIVQPVGVGEKRYFEELKRLGVLGISFFYWSNRVATPRTLSNKGKTK